VFNGLADFESSLAVFDQQKPISETLKRKFTTDTGPIDSVDTDVIFKDTNSIKTMSVLEAIKTQFITSKGNHLFTRVYPPLNGQLECRVHKSLFFQARKLTNDAFLNSLATIIPIERHSLVFEKPKNVSNVGTIPSKLLHNKISEWIKNAPSFATKSDFQPKTRSKQPKKIIIFHGYAQAAALMPSITKTPRETNSVVTPSVTNTSVSSIPSELTSDVHSLFDSLQKKVDNRLGSIEKRQTEDHNELLNMRDQMSKFQTTVNQNTKRLSEFESEVVATIDTSVKQHFTTYATTFEEKLQATLESTAIRIENKNEERATIAKKEHENFVLEFRDAHNALKSMLRKVLIESQDSNVVFTQDTDSEQTNENPSDLSFDNL
jgi:hypothetical protein